MAILKGMKVSVVVGDVALPEYDAVDQSDQGESKVARYIEARPDEQFTVKIATPKNFDMQGTYAGYSALVFLDGVRVRRKIIKLHYFKDHEYSLEVGGARSYKNGRYGERPFQFARIQMDFGNEISHDVVDQSKARFSDIGCIEIAILRASSIKTKSSTPYTDPRSNELSRRGTKVPAKALKGSGNSICVALGAHTNKNRKSTFYNARNFDTENLPYLKFTFRYRSHEALQALGLLPRSPSPPPAPPAPALRDRNVDSMTKEEMQAMLKRLQEREKLEETYKIGRIKREGIEAQEKKPSVKTLEPIVIDSDSDSSEGRALSSEVSGRKQNDIRTTPKREADGKKCGKPNCECQRCGGDDDLEITSTVTRSKRRRLNAQNATEVISLD